MIHDLILSGLKIVLDEVFLLFGHFLWLCQENNVRLRIFLFFHHSWILCFFFQIIRRQVLTWFFVDNAPWAPCTHVYLNIHLLLIWGFIQVDDFFSTLWSFLFCNTLGIRKIRWTTCFFRCFSNMWRSLKVNFFGSIMWRSLISKILCLNLKKFLTLLIPQFR